VLLAVRVPVRVKDWLVRVALECDGHGGGVSVVVVVTTLVAGGSSSHDFSGGV